MSKQKVSIKTIIASVIRDLQLKDVSKYIDSIIEWSYEAEMKIGSYESFERKECVVKIKNNRVPLPKDFYKLISFKVGSTFPEITNRDFRLFHKESTKLAASSNGFPIVQNYYQAGDGVVTSIDSGSSDGTIKMSVDNGYINLSSSSNSNEGALSYLAIAMDEDGYPLIQQGHETAIVSYCVWKMKLSDYVSGKLPHHVYAELEKRWVWLCGQARGEDEMPNPKELEYLAAMYNQLMPLPNKNLF